MKILTMVLMLDILMLSAGFYTITQPQWSCSVIQNSDLKVVSPNHFVAVNQSGVKIAIQYPVTDTWRFTYYNSTAMQVCNNSPSILSMWLFYHLGVKP